MFIADALSRSYRLTTDDAQHDSGEVCGLREVHHTDGLSVSPKRLEESKLCTAQDPQMQLLTCQIQKGGPSSRTIPRKLKRANWRKRAGLSWWTLSHSTLAAHWYAEKKKPLTYRNERMLMKSQSVKDFVSQCSICQSFQPEQCREDLQAKPCMVESRSWPIQTWSTKLLNTGRVLVQLFRSTRTQTDHLHNCHHRLQSAVCKTWNSWCPDYRQRDTI